MIGLSLQHQLQPQFGKGSKASKKIKNQKSKKKETKTKIEYKYVVGGNFNIPVVSVLGRTPSGSLRHLVDVTGDNFTLHNARACHGLG